MVPGFLRHGGVSHVARQLASTLADHGVETWVVTDRGRDDDLPLDEDRLGGILVVDQPDLPFPLDVLGFAARAAPVVRRLHRRHRFDLLHAHGHSLLAAGLFDQLRLVRCPLLATAHGTYLNELASFGDYPAFEGAWRYRAGVRLDQRVLAYGCGRADRIHAVAARTEEELVEMGFDDGTIDVVPNGIDVPRFDAELDAAVDVREERDLDDAPLVVSVGSVVPRKGLHVLAKAAARLPDAHPQARVVHVGGGGHAGYADALDQLVNASGGAMSRTGYVDRGELLGWLDAADVFVSPSFSEGCPISILEAAASGTTVVATDVGGTREILGDDGLYVPVADPAALAEGIDGGLARVDRGRALRDRVEAEFAWTDLAGEVAGIYRRTLA